MVTPSSNTNPRTSSLITASHTKSWKSSLKSKLIHQQKNIPSTATTVNNNIKSNYSSSPNDNNTNSKIMPVENDNIASLQSLKQKFMSTTNEMTLLPWEKYKTTTEYSNNKEKSYDEMIQELNISYARVAAANFDTLSINEADKLVKKFTQLKNTLESMYGKIKLNTDTIRVTVKALRLHMPHSTDVFQLNEYTSQVKWLLDEFYFTSKYANHLETKYLQHLAGTLNSDNMKTIDNNNLTAILNRLKEVIDIQNNDGEFYVLSQQLSSSCVSLVSSISSSSTSSSSKTIQVQHSDTSNSNHAILLQDIYTAIEKISHKLKQTIHNAVESQEKNSNTYMELAKQKERSAELVLQLERNRSQRLLMTQQKDSNEILALREELAEKSLKCQHLQDRVTALELQLKEKANFEEQDRLLQLESENKQWLDMEKRIKDQCSTIILDHSEQNLEMIVNHLIQDRETSIGLRHELERIAKNKQLELDQLKIEKDTMLNQYHATIDCEKLNDKKNDMVTQFKSDDTTNLLNITQQKLVHLQRRFDQAIKTYTARESAYILQSASTEAELGRILKEYDRLTRNIIDFNHERKKFEQELQDMYVENAQLSKLLLDEQIIKISGNDSMLRKEFRSLMASVKEKHKKEMIHEIQSRRKIEHILREKTSEAEMRRWEKVDTAVQTYMQLPYL